MDSTQRAREAMDKLEAQYTARTLAERQEKAEKQLSPMDTFKKALAHDFFHRFDKYVK